MRLGIAILVGAVIPGLVFGPLWYGPLFLEPWMSGIGFTRETIGEGSALLMMLPLIGWIFTAAAMNGLYSLLMDQSWRTLIRATIYVGVAGTLLANLFVNVFDPSRKLYLIAIDSGYIFVGFAVILVASKLIYRR